VGVARDDGATKGEYSPIFYRKKEFKLLDSGTFWLSETPDEVSYGWGAKHRRICTWGLFVDKKSKTKFYFLNLHMDHRVKAAQENGAKLVLDFVKTKCKKGVNVIITGDFNVTQESAVYDIFAKSGIFQDTYDVAKYRFAPTGTVNGFNPNRYTTRRIDHIFVSKGIKVSRYGVLTYHYFRDMKAELQEMETAVPKNIKGENRDSKCISDHYPIQAWVTLK
jgi:endonuclease/exonuclease/phosphatase family metal-dependent hydrolase